MLDKNLDLNTMKENVKKGRKKCKIYVNKGTYFGGMTYLFSEITGIKQDSIIVFTDKFESEISLDEVSVILINQKAE